MTPLTQLNSSPSFFPAELKEDQLFTPNPQPSSSSLSSHIFFNLTPQDQNGYNYHGEVHHPHNQQDQADNFGSHGGSYDIENESDSGLKFSIWKQEVRNENQSESENQVKWMSSKMRLMQKMKNSDQTAVIAPPRAVTMKLEDQKQPSPPMETDNCSNSSSNNSNNPIRVCSDCNTTKTPLWRSGPRGPKSLCNACGIRQRKARRAMAAVAAAANGTILPTASPTPKISKAQHKDKRSNGGHVAKFKKKQCKLTATPSQGREKLCLEDFLISLSKNLAFHRVFPQDEKEAAILLMALSCGHVHG